MASRTIGVARRALPTDALGNPLILDPSGRPISTASSPEEIVYQGRQPGPGIPLDPYIPRPGEPRQTFFPSGSNLNYIPRREFAELTPFQTLRNLADTSDIVRLCIEDVKQQVVALEWDIHPAKKETGKAAKVTQTRLAANIERAKRFFEYPDGEHSFRTWLTMLLEDCLVIDAMTFYRQRTLGGEPLALVPIDGATIKPLVDFYGRGPLPPFAAYQQVGYGRVETEFTRPYRRTDELRQALAGIEPGARPVELIYAPKNPRTFIPYGQSPVERVIITINLALRRQLHYLAYYTDGNIPEAFWKCPEAWEPGHIEDMQDKFEKMLVGESALRRRLRFMPGGEGSGLENPRGDDEWKKDFDEYLARVVCYAFNTSPLALVQLMNRSTGEMADAEETDSGHHPLMEFIAEKLTREVQEFLGEPELEFIWTEQKSRDETAFVEKSRVFVASGIYNRNEVRAEEGLDAIDGGEVYTVDTASGPIPISDFALNPLAPGVPEKKNPLDVPLPPAAGGGSAMGGGRGENAPAPADARPGEAARALDVPLPPAAQGKLTARMTAEDLRRWRKLALRGLAGDAARWKKALNFTSTAIHPATSKAILISLGEARIPEDVDWTFRYLAKAKRPLVSARRRYKLERKLRAQSQAHFVKVAPDVAAIYSGSYTPPAAEKIRKVDEPPDEIVDAAMQWDVYVETITPTLEESFLEGETLAADATGAEVAFGLTDSQAAEYALQRGAELVGKRVLPNGTVIDNPNSRWSIPDSVRQRLKETLAKAFDEGWSERRLQEEIESPTFWSWRSDMIARTEVATALNNGTAETYRSAGIEKVQIVDGPGCLLDGHDDALPGVDGTVVTVDEFQEFPVGHPNCRRDSIPIQEET